MLSRGYTNHEASKMIKAVLDTNVFVSSIFWSGPSHRVVLKALEKRIAVFISPQLLKELDRVLRRDFTQPDYFVHRQISLILDYATVVQSSLKLTVVKKDP